eukprot:m.41110 g.41110  ORF g.41110 m.41110 type:complete len:210 (-) comp18707_c1_seq1:49-678(-)
MISSLGQWINVGGLVSTIRFVALRQRWLAIPHQRVTSVNDIDFQSLQNAGVTGVIFDKDNCLTIPYVDHVHANSAKGLEQCKQIFGDRVVIFSNGAGSADDVGHAAAHELEKTIGVHVLKHNTKKPEGIEYVNEYFKSPPSQLAMIGDRYLTDMVFGNQNGMVTIYTAPISTQQDNLAVKTVRTIEKYFVNSWVNKGLTAPANEIADKL